MDLKWPTPAELAPSWNVAPTQNAPLVRERPAAQGCAGGREAVLARWGLVPAWAKDGSIGGPMINARSETAAAKPAFRAAMGSRRCIVPVSGFYEWQRDAAGPKRPWYIYRADGQIMLLAGLWERWNGGAGSPLASPLETFAILTTSANTAVARIHDRMPVVLEPEQVSVWLGPDARAEDLNRLLAPAADGILAMHRVGTGVNRPVRNDPGLIEPVEDEPPGGLFGAAQGAA
jgi:putative SOS response-associated peptidase YedK